MAGRGVRLGGSGRGGGCWRVGYREEVLTELHAPLNVGVKLYDVDTACDIAPRYWSPWLQSLRDRKLLQEKGNTRIPALIMCRPVYQRLTRFLDYLWE